MEDNQQGIVDPTNEGPKNPAKIFIQWKSKDEKFSYWNKQKEENTMLPMPFTFIPLYRCVTVKGYNHKKKKTYIANEVENINDDAFVVKSHNTTTKEKKVEHSGMYADIKEDFDQNIKYTESIYAAIKNKKGELSLVNLQLNGAGLHHWFEFYKTGIWGKSVTVKKFTEEVNGDVEYKAPVYEIGSISKEDNIACGKLQKEIKDYLKAYFEKNRANVQEVSKPSQNEQKQPKKEVEKETAKTTKVADTETFDPGMEDDDLPF